MIRAVFLAHSGFLVESDSAALLFDWWKGELPAIRPGVLPVCCKGERKEIHFIHLITIT